MGLEMVVVFDTKALVGSQEKIRARSDQSRKTAFENSRRSTQCFICSRIYFDRELSKCPNCGSNSLQHYTSADLNHFAHNGV